MSKITNIPDNKKYLAKSKDLVRALVDEKITKLGTKLNYFAALKTVHEYKTTGIIPEKVSFPIDDFLKKMGISHGTAYNKFVSKTTGMRTTALRNEMNKVITFRFLVPRSEAVIYKKEFDEKDYKSYVFFTSAEIEPETNSCVFEINRNLFLNNFIDLKEKQFVTTPFSLVSNVKNDYTVKFYEFFKSFVWQPGFVYNKEWEIDNLKFLLGIKPAKSYVKNFGNLKLRILDPAVKEICDTTDINLTYKVKTTSRKKVTHIVFFAKLKGFGYNPEKYCNISNEEFLRKMLNKENNKQFTKIIQELNDFYALSIEVINCVFDYVWIQNKQNLEPNYIFSIANTLYKNKINNDIKLVCKHLKTAQQKSIKNQIQDKLNKNQQNQDSNEIHAEEQLNEPIVNLKDFFTEEDEENAIIWD